MKRILYVAVVFITMASCAVSCTDDTVVGPDNDAQPVSLQSVEHEIHQLINEHRHSIGIMEDLRFIESIATIAREHSQNMADGVVAPGHSGLDERAAEMRRIAGASSVGENVVMFCGDRPKPVPEYAVELWLGSPGHKENLEHETWEITGIGAVYNSKTDCYYITQLFADH